MNKFVSRIYIFSLLFYPLYSLSSIPKFVELSHYEGEPFEVSLLKSQPKKIPWIDVFSKKGEVVKSDEINFKYAKGRQWIKFGLKNSQKTNQYIVVHVDIVYLEHFQYRLIANDSLKYQSKEYSWQTPLNVKPLNDRYFSFPLIVRPSEEITVLISLEGSGGILFTPIYLFSYLDFALEKQAFNLVFYGIIIVNVVFIITLLFSFLFLRKRFLFYLLIYIIGYLAYILQLEGFFAAYLSIFGGNIKWLPISSITSSMFIFLFLLKLLEESATIDRYLFVIYRKIEKYFLISYIVFVSVIFLLPYNIYCTKFALIVSYVSALMSIVLLLYKVFNKNPNAILFLLVIFPSIILKVLTNVGISESIHYPYISNFNLYYLKYIVPVYEFYSLGLAVIMILFKNFKIASNQLRLTHQNFISATEAERQRLAQDLHDDLGGTLSALKGRITNEPVKPETLNLIEKAINDLSVVSRNLLPPELETEGLIQAIKYTTERLQNASKIEFTYIVFGQEFRFPQEYELNLYRIIAELLNNVVKHSKATKAVVQMIFHVDYLHVSVEDNGTGIKTEQNTWGIGLKNISSRVEFLKAHLFIDSSRDRGTTIIVELSYPAVSA